MPPNQPVVLNPVFTDVHPLPPLPTFVDSDIHTKVFTHRSLYARPNHVFEDHPDDPSPDNERFEHLGDIVLGLVVTGLLYDMYPDLRVGPSTKIRALIVGNATLAAISRRYELPAQLKLHPAQAISLRASIKIQANVFESYVGGVYLDRGLPVVEQWLNSLLKSYATEAYRRVRAEHGLPPLPELASLQLAPSTSASSTSSGSDEAPSTSASEASNQSTRSTSSTPARRNLHHQYPHASGTHAATGHLALFNQLLQKDRRDVEWLYNELNSEGTATTPIWEARVEVEGEIFGRGRGGTKKVARNEAAKEGLIRMGVTA